MAENKFGMGTKVSQQDVQKLEMSGGNPLPMDVKSHLQAQVGYDLSAVRVHTGPNAQELTRKVGAQAFTVGNRVVLSPDVARTPEGKRLLAHELTHVVQQNSGRKMPFK